MNPYEEILKLNLPRLYSCYDLDKSSSTYGFGDRLYWGWKVSDFSNATLQGGVHALAAAIHLNLVESQQYTLELIDAAIRAIPKMTTSKGSVQEAYPNEHSFCVSALVAFDVLSAIDLLDQRISKEQKEAYIQSIAPLIDFISKNDEEHAIISNHLATGVAAIVLWNKLTGEQNNRYSELLDIIYSHQSQEGWYLEYEGPDMGYQTLCTYYLSAANRILKDERLYTSLEKSLRFLSYFIHPNGTVGGLHGSRNTEVYYPGGIVELSSDNTHAALLKTELEKGIASKQHVFPQDIDSGNYVPCLNAYAYAALHYNEVKPSEDSFYKASGTLKFEHAGIFLKSTQKYFAIINYKKGGTLKVYDQISGIIDCEDGGLYGETHNGTTFSTQVFDATQTFESETIHTKFYKKDTSTPSPFIFMTLRFLSLTVFRSLRLGNAFKKLVVRKLMTGKKTLDGHAVRSFLFEEHSITVREQWSAPSNTKSIQHIGKFKAIHMASSGYYLPQQHDSSSKSKFVTFHEVDS